MSEAIDDDKLPEQFYIEYLYGGGEYNDFGIAWNSTASKETQNDFINFIKNKSRFKINYNMIISNMNYISYLYISRNNFNNVDFVNKDYPNHDMDICSYAKWARAPMISKKLIKEKYPEIYQLLLKGQDVVIAWTMGHHTSYCRKKVVMCDFLESRINHDLFSTFRYMRLLIHKLKDDGGDEWIPDEVMNSLNIVFWYIVKFGNAEWYNNTSNNKYIDNKNKLSFSAYFKGQITNRYSKFVDEIYDKMNDTLCEFHFFMNRIIDAYKAKYHHNPILSFNIDNPSLLYIAEEYRSGKCISDEETLHNIVEHLFKIEEAA